MSEIMTNSHKMFDPLHPNAELIDIADIAHSLSMLCRANGHFKSFYSVGQHCINCAVEAKARGYSKFVQLACLLHDGSEAYLSDVTRPVKAELPRYLEIEEPLQNCIWDKFLGRPLSPTEYNQVFEIDDAILYYEFVELFGERIFDYVPTLMSNPRFDYIEFSHIENEFISLFNQLTTSNKE